MGSSISTLTAAGSDTPFAFSAVTVIVPVYASEGSPLITRVYELGIFTSPAGIISGLVIHVTGFRLSAVMIAGIINPLPSLPLIVDISGLIVGLYA